MDHKNYPTILSRDHDEQQQLGVTKERLEMMETIEFENSLQEPKFKS